jgi:long-chain fatty acid transport protein
MRRSMTTKVLGWCWRKTGSALRIWMPSMCVMGLCVAGLSGMASAQVPRIQGQGTAASAMTNAFSAQADDPSALHYNPAGMTQLQGVQLMAGALASGGTTNFTSLTGATASGDRNGSAAWPPPGHTYITANLKSLGVTALGDLSVGVGLTVPFGSLTRWPNDGPFRTTTTFSTLPLLAGCGKTLVFSCPVGYIGISI